MNQPKIDWRSLAARMRADLDRCDLTGRCRRLAEFTVKVTLAAGRTRVVIPNRMELCRLLHIGKTHVAEVSAALVSARIVQITVCADGWELLVFPDSSQWNVDWLYSREEMARFVAGLNGAPGQCQGELIEGPPSLDRTLAVVSAENSAGYQNGNPRVTKMGTTAPLNFKGSKTYKALKFESLKDAVVEIEGKDESRAMEGFRHILGERVMANDGGKWRLRWRSYHGKTHRVFASGVEDMLRGAVRLPGAHMETLWKEFAD